MYSGRNELAWVSKRHLLHHEGAVAQTSKA
jgi:hypothetical protein